MKNINLFFASISLMLFTMSCRNDNLSEFSYKENGQSSDNISFDKDVTYNFNTKNELYNTIWNDKSAKTRSTIEAPNNFISLLDKIQEDDSIYRITPWGTLCGKVEHRELIDNAYEQLKSASIDITCNDYSNKINDEVVLINSFNHTDYITRI